MPPPSLTLHIEMISGVAGNMLVAALLDLFPNPRDIQRQLIESLSQIRLQEQISMELTTCKPGSIKALLINFKTPKDDWNKNKHEHPHSNNKPNAKHHRNFTDIETLIKNSSYSFKVKSQILVTFEILAQAEGSVHGIDYREVHFHEVGSFDAILEVCSFFLLIEKLNINKITATPLVIGRGVVKCNHGQMPVPVPAVLNMIATHKIPYKKLTWDTGELTTPTGLAILLGSGCQFNHNFYSPGNELSSSITAIGYGAGDKSIPQLVNLIRTSIHKNQSHPYINTESVVEIKINLDDMNGEEIALLINQIFESGALDVCQYPVYMKKSRPGVVLEILCQEKDREIIGKLILQNSSAIGYRYSSWEREILTRRSITINYMGEQFLIKEVTLPNGNTRIKIEDESLKAGLKKIPLNRRELVQKIIVAYQNQQTNI